MSNLISMDTDFELDMKRWMRVDWQQQYEHILVSIQNKDCKKQGYYKMLIIENTTKKLLNIHRKVNGTKIKVVLKGRNFLYYSY
jgi:hypothetical protein